MHPKPSATQLPGYRPDIDGLRSLAVLPVLLFHCGMPGFGGGYVGVDVFFVISGYLITGHLAGELAEGRASILGFYARRIRRIGPALFCTLIVTWLVAILLLLPSNLESASEVMIAAATSVSNIYLWKTANYFAADSAFQPFLHTWSLSVEEQFYAVIPIAMIVTARPLRQRWTLLILPFCLASLALSIFMTSLGPTANFYLLPTRAWELGIGSLLATAHLPTPGRAMADIIGWVALAILAAVVTLFSETTSFPGLNALLPCGAAVLLLYVGKSPACLPSRLLCWPPFVGVGLISYSLYLVHWPIIVFVRYYSIAPLSGRQIVAIVAASLVLATLSWRFIEQPARRYRNVASSVIVLSGLVGIALVCLLGYSGVRAGGFPSRFPNFKEQAILGHAVWLPQKCFLGGNPVLSQWSPQECTRIATGPRRVMLWGDSFAAQYIPGIISQANRLKATVIEYTAAGCPPVLSFRSYSRIGCTAFNAHAIDIIRAQHIDTVILSARWTDLESRGLNQLKSTLKMLGDLGVRVIVIGQSPEFPEDVQIISFLKGSQAPDATNRWTVFFDPAINTRLVEIAEGATFINPMSALCDGTRCTYQDKGVYLFEDFGHLSALGSDRVVRSLFEPGGRSILAN